MNKNLIFITTIFILTFFLNTLYGQNSIKESLNKYKSEKDIELIENLIGEDIDGRDEEEGMSALMISALHGYTDIARELINSKASVNITDYFGHTALMFSSKQDLEITKMLIEAKANANLKDDVLENTALMYAKETGT